MKNKEKYIALIKNETLKLAIQQGSLPFSDKDAFMLIQNGMGSFESDMAAFARLLNDTEDQLIKDGCELSIELLNRQMECFKRDGESFIYEIKFFENDPVSSFSYFSKTYNDVWDKVENEFSNTYCDEDCLDRIEIIKRPLFMANNPRWDESSSGIMDISKFKVITSVISYEEELSQLFDKLEEIKMKLETR